MNIFAMINSLPPETGYWLLGIVFALFFLGILGAGGNGPTDECKHIRKRG